MASLQCRKVAAALTVVLVVAYMWDDARRRRHRRTILAGAQRLRPSLPPARRPTIEYLQARFNVDAWSNAKIAKNLRIFSIFNKLSHPSFYAFIRRFSIDSGLQKRSSIIITSPAGDKRVRLDVSAAVEASRSKIGCC